MANSTSLRAESLPVATSNVQLIRNSIIYWHLLSLDAPSVAMLWTWFIARSCRISLPLDSILAMGVAVWILYASDRLLDARNSPRTALELRHRFHRTHQKAFQVGIAFNAAILALLVTRLTPSSARLYAMLAAPLAGYFALIHVRRRNPASRPIPRLPKEIAVGIFFSAATFIPTVAEAPALRRQLFATAILFGFVCSLNCLFIYAWEHPSSAPIHPAHLDANLDAHLDAHPATRCALRFLPQLTCCIIIASLGLLLSPFSAAPTLLSAVGLAAAFLLLLHRSRHHLNPTTLRVAADICLLTPILFAFTLPT